MLPHRALKAYKYISGTVIAFFLVAILVTFLSLHVRKVGAQSCPSELTSTITTTVTLTPSSADNVIDCTGVDVTIASGGKLIIQSARIGDSDYTNDKGVVLKVNNINIQSGGSIDANGQGYPAGSTETPGNVANALGATSGSGGGHGGAGGEGLSDGTNAAVNPGGAFGAIEGPIELGGAGGISGDGGLGGAGGGAINIQATGTVTIDGQISANGQDGLKSGNGLSSGGGGAGGSVWIESDGFAGSGSVIAAGGGSDNSAIRVGGGGGGGRIVMLCNTSTTFSGSLNVTGGITGAQSGQTGTKIGVACRPAKPTKVHVYEKDTGNELTVGSLTRDRNLRIASDMIVSGSPGAQVKLQVEIREAAQSFTGIYTNAATSFSTSPLNCNNPPADCGLLDINGLAGDKDYKIRVRVVNPANVFSDWADFGTNGDGADVSTIGDPANVLKISGDNQTAEVAQQLSQPLTVKITDPAGYALSGITVVFNVDAGGGSVSDRYVTTDAGGFASTNVTVGTHSGSNNNVITAYVGNGSIYTSFTASSNPGPIARYTVTAPSVVLINQNFTINIQAYDQYNNPSNISQSVDLRPVLNDGTTPANGTLTPSSVNIVNGIAQVTNTQYGYEETMKIRVQDASLKFGVSSNVSVVSTVGTCPNRDIDQPTEWKAIDVPGGIYDCRGATLFIRNGGDLKLTSYDNGDGVYTNDFGVTLLADNIVIEPLGKIEANGAGFTDGRGPGGNAYGGLAAYGAGVLYGNVYHPFDLGGGGSPGAGGGAMKFVVNGAIQNDGIIESNGTDVGDWYQTGGTGGSIWVDADTIVGNGTIQANGGRACSRGQYNAGGGRIALYYNTTSGTMIQSLGSDLPQVVAYGGVCGSIAGAGTVYVEHKGVDVAGQAKLYMDNNGNDGASGGLIAKTDPNDNTYQFSQIYLKRKGNFVVQGSGTVINLTSGLAVSGDTTKPRFEVEGTLDTPSPFNINGIDVYVKGDINIGGNTPLSDITVGNSQKAALTLFAHTWAHDKANYYRFKNLTVGSNGQLNMIGYDSGDNVYGGDDFGVRVDAENITISAGGIMTADADGYQNGRGPGWNAHGGFGGSHSGTPYGNVYQPDELGSAGTYTGGGAIRLVVSNTFDNEGLITANGSDVGDWYQGGGAGGSVWIDAATVTGDGTIQANGGYASSRGNYNGSGGRIAVYYNNVSGQMVSSVPTTSPRIVAYGGTAGPAGGAGTVYLEHKGVDPAGKAKLYIDNRGYTGDFATLIAKTDPNDLTYEFQEIHVKNYGNLQVLGSQTILNLSTNTAITGDTTQPSVSIDGTFKGPSPLQVNGINLTINGKLDLGIDTAQSDITIGNTQVGTMTINAKTWFYDKTNYYHLKNLTVNSQGKLNLVSYDSGDTIYTDDFGVRIDAQNITVAAGGFINADYNGYQSGRGPGWNAYGGFGAARTGTPYGNVYQPTDLGSGGTYRGGGAVHFVASDTLHNDGIISSNGLDVGDWYQGGGTGGSIWVEATNLLGDGTIQANGGYASSRGNYNGSGGRIAIYYNNSSGQLLSSVATATPHITAYGGTAGPAGAAGTVYIEQRGIDPAGKANLYIDNRGYDGSPAALIAKTDPNDLTYEFQQVYVKNKGNLVVLGDQTIFKINNNTGITGDSSVPSIEIDGTFIGPAPLNINGYNMTIKGELTLGGNTSQSDVIVGDTALGALTLYAKTWAHDKDNYYHFKNLTVSSQGTLTLVSYDSGDGIYTDDFGMRIDVQNITVAAGGIINSDYQGYQNGRGPGGDSYGGIAGDGSGTIYGNVYEPIDLGSGGGSSYRGGGAIRFVVSNTFTNDGIISTNGDNVCGNYQGAGTGGSVWIDTNILGGNGTIRANGGSQCETSSNNGSGGRIAVYYNNASGTMISSVPTATPHITAYGGCIRTAGGSGTVYIEQKGVDPAGKAKLYMDNNGCNGSAGGLIAKTDPNDRIYQFESIYVKNYGNFIVQGDNTILKLTDNNAIVGDGTRPQVEVNGTLDAPAPLVINGFTVVAKGELTLGGNTAQSDITIGNISSGGLTLYAKTWAHDKDNQYTFKNVNIGSNGIVTLVGNDNNDNVWANDYGVTLNLTNLTVSAGGTITADGQGFLPGHGPGAYGSYGGMSTSGGPTYGSIYRPTDLGSGGSNNIENGGGAIKINVANTLHNDGIISANGVSYWCCSVASAGGSIWLNTNVIEGDGAVQANGGWSDNRGGGGRVAIYYTSGSGTFLDSLVNATTQDNPHPKATAYGGDRGNNEQQGGPGTVYLEQLGVDQAQRGTLIIDNNGILGNGMDFTSGTWSFKDIYIGKNVIVRAVGNPITESGPIFDASNNFVLQSGAQIYALGSGFPSGTGPGNGHNGTGNAGGGGGGHGGNGGTSDTDGLTPAAIGGSKYGAQYFPLTLGSGGGFAGPGGRGGDGGGAVGVYAKNGSAKILGTINASGTNGSGGGGGGAGGSILIYANTCTISGNLIANGGSGNGGSYAGGGGGGGRISVLYLGATCTVSNLPTVAAGDGASTQPAQVGTYISPITVPLPPQFMQQYEVVNTP